MNHAQKLKLAVRLLSADLIIGLLSGLISAYLTYTITARFPVSSCIGAIVSALIYGFIIWQIHSKQNWARIISLIIYIISLIATVVSLVAFNFTFGFLTSEMSANGPIPSKTFFVVTLIVIPVIQRIIEGVGLYNLFSKGMGDFFKNNKA